MDNPLVDLNVETFLRAANQHRLVYPECTACAGHFFPPRVACPYCLSDDIAFVESDGLGRLYSYSVVRTDGHPDRGTEAPYPVALVQLDDGPIIFSTVIDCDPAALTVGMPLTVEFEPFSADQQYPVFTPT